MSCEPCCCCCCNCWASRSPSKNPRDREPKAASALGRTPLGLPKLHHHLLVRTQHPLHLRQLPHSERILGLPQTSPAACYYENCTTTQHRCSITQLFSSRESKATLMSGQWRAKLRQGGPTGGQLVLRKELRQMLFPQAKHSAGPRSGGAVVRRLSSGAWTLQLCTVKLQLTRMSYPLPPLPHSSLQLVCPTGLSRS